MVVPRPVEQALEGDDRFSLHGIRAHTLRDIGRVPLWLLRRKEEEMSLLDKARLRREAGRAWIEERFGALLPSPEVTAPPPRRPTPPIDSFWPRDMTAGCYIPRPERVTR